MTGKETPFGYRYSGNTVFIKLRLLSSKFFHYGIDRHGQHKTTQSGYVIFEGTFDVGSAEFTAVSDKLKRLKASNFVVKPDENELPF